MKDKLLKIIDHYGLMTQLKYFQSEVFELNEAIIKYDERNNYCVSSDDWKHIVEEIADVCVFIRQFMEYFEISQDDVVKIMENKVKRQIDRIDAEIILRGSDSNE